MGLRYSNPPPGLTAKGKRMYRHVKGSGSAAAPSAVVYAAAERGGKGLVTKKWAKAHGYPKPNKSDISPDPLPLKVEKRMRHAFEQGKRPKDIIRGMVWQGVDPELAKYYAQKHMAEHGVYVKKILGPIGDIVQKEIPKGTAATPKLIASLMQVDEEELRRLVDERPNPPVVADVDDIAKMLDIDEDDAQKLKKVLEEANSNKEVREALEFADELIGGHGIEAIEKRDADVDHYYGDAIAVYVNTGDMYAGTVLYSTEEREFYITTYADWLEARERGGPGFRD
jgi:hypothetical protein